jgi:hypothetical protein
MTFDEWWKKETDDNENNVDDWKGFCKTAFEAGQKEIKQLGERCNQLLKDKGELTDKIADIKANCDLAIEGRDIKIKELELELTVEKDLHQEETNLHLHAEEYIKSLEKENAELKEELKNWKDEWQEQVQKAIDEGYARTQQTIQLTKAKKLLKQFLEAKNSEDTYKAEWEAEQFLKEIEKC